MTKEEINVANGKTEFLTTEYSALSDHFRAYQSNRLNVMLLSVPAFGGLMLQCYEKNHGLQIISCIILYLLLLVLINIDIVFMKRLRNYTIRLAAIENEFKIWGFSSERLLNVTGGTRDATTKTSKSIIHILNASTFSYSLVILCVARNCKKENCWCADFDFCCHLVWIPAIVTIVLFIYTQSQLDTTKLDKSIKEFVTEGKDLKKD